MSQNVPKIKVENKVQGEGREGGGGGGGGKLGRSDHA